MTAGFLAITSTRVYGMHRTKLYGVVVRGEQSSYTMTSTMGMTEHGHVLVQTQLQLILNDHQKLRYAVSGVVL